MHELMASLYLALHNDAEQAAAWLPAAPAAEKGGLGGGGPAADGVPNCGPLPDSE